MSECTLKVRYSQFSVSAVTDELRRRYALEEPVSCSFFNFGLNDIYKVSAGKETFYLRISLAGIHEKRDYEEEASIINTLSENGINVAKPVGCRDGSFIWEITAPEGKRFAVLFTEAKNAPSDDNKKQTYNLGSMAAHLHIIADEKDFKVSREPIGLIQLGKKPLTNIYPFLSHRKEDFEFLSSASDKLCKYVEKNFGYKKPCYGFCHGDIHSGNVFFDGDMPVIFDFDCMGYGWRAYDICVFAWNKTFGDEKYAEGKEWKAFLDGYNSVRQLSRAEMESINSFAALRELWLMGLHASLMKRNAEISWYNDGYFDHNIKIFKLWYGRAFPNEV